VRVAYVTAGTVGAGHLVRGVALGRALQRAGADATYAMFGPATPFPVAVPFAQHAVALDPLTLGDPASAPETPLGQALRAFRPDLVLVDLFWAPLRHVLPALPGCEAWLLVRQVPAAWFAGPPRSPFDRTQWARVVAIEPCVVPVPHESVAPVVVANPDEAAPPGALRARLGAAEPSLQVAVHAGQPGELDALLQAAPPGTRALDLRAPGAPFPACLELGGADGLHLGGGYNSVWESVWMGYAARCRYTPFVRRLDDQAWRCRVAPSVAMRGNGADALVRQALGR
jgi:hypothetical protein